MNKSPQYLEKEKNSIISAKKKFRLLQRNVMDKIEPQTLKFRCDAFNVGVAQVPMCKFQEFTVMIISGVGNVENEVI